MLVGRSVARMPGIVSGGCGRAGVEEIMGSWIPFGGPGSGMGMLLGSRTATRIRFGCVRFSGCPWRDAVGLAGRVLSGRVVV